MILIQQFMDELAREAPRTRGVLAEVPHDRDDWKPHARSMPLGRLAGLVASMPSWVNLILEQDELDLTPSQGGGQVQLPPTSGLLEVHDQMIARAREALSQSIDAFLLNTSWRLRAGGQVVMEQPRHIVLRETINHLAHHRGQLTVYLRMNECRVPSIYGPTADDQRFG
jgi:uncharacterized damage-inducible protein DinB